MSPSNILNGLQQTADSDVEHDRVIVECLAKGSERGLGA
jgi:hypothetical protein